MADRNYSLKRSVKNSADVKEILDGIAAECKLLFKQAITAHGFNDKPHAKKDTLTGSKLYEEIETKSDGNGLIEILVNDYIDYIQRGRKGYGEVPKKDRKPGTFPPVDVIADWAAEKGITTDNSVVWAICQSIYKNGIKPRPIVEMPENLWTSPNNPNDLFFDLCDEMWDDWSQQIFDASTEELNKIFNE